MNQCTDRKGKKRNYCKSDNKHKEQQNDKPKMLKKDFEIIKCGEGKLENLDFFFFLNNAFELT